MKKRKYEIIGSIIAGLMFPLMAAMVFLALFDLMTEFIACLWIFAASGAGLLWSNHKVEEIERRERKRRRDAARRYQFH